MLQFLFYNYICILDKLSFKASQENNLHNLYPYTVKSVPIFLLFSQNDFIPRIRGIDNMDTPIWTVFLCIHFAMYNPHFWRRKTLHTQKSACQFLQQIHLVLGSRMKFKCLIRENVECWCANCALIFLWWKYFFFQSIFFTSLQNVDLKKNIP